MMMHWEWRKQLYCDVYVAAIRGLTNVPVGIHVEPPLMATDGLDMRPVRDDEASRFSAIAANLAAQAVADLDKEFGS